ncbi:hypothetical protein ACGFNU_47640 [Spirillospora sp. NPDC048911]|uniref:hypothetical protein n=1 Tax=Spirillospora sp. NPDC048911 TaxID=3364527 RepID=UPI0037191D2B
MNLDLAHAARCSPRKVKNLCGRCDDLVVPVTRLSRGLKTVGSDAIANYRSLATNHVIALVGTANRRELVADDVDDWLEVVAEGLSSRSVRLVHGVLKRTIRHAQARNRVLRNVAELVDTPQGRSRAGPAKP